MFFPGVYPDVGIYLAPLASGFSGNVRGFGR